MPPKSRVEKGRLGENLACEHLVSRGMTLLERNVRTAGGEIDIVAREADVLVFVEVRSRHCRGFGAPQETVTAAKQRRLTGAALAYLQERNLAGVRARFDVAAVTFHSAVPPRVVWIVNAFDAQEEAPRG